MTSGPPDTETGRTSPALPGYVPRRRQGVLDLDTGDGVVLYDDDVTVVHHLNPPAALVWRLSDGRASVRTLAREIAEAYGLDESEVRAQVGRVVAELETRELLEDARGDAPGGPSPRP